MDPEITLELLITASGAKTDEEKARIAWRFSDAMWRKVGSVPMGFARQFNNLLQDQQWPWVKDLYSAEEVAALKAQYEAGMVSAKFIALHELWVNE